MFAKLYLFGIRLNWNLMIHIIHKMHKICCHTT